MGTQYGYRNHFLNRFGKQLNRYRNHLPTKTKCNLYVAGIILYILSVVTGEGRAVA